VLAVRYPRGNRIRKLAVIDQRSLRRWTTRLRRRSALGQEILIRPIKNAPVLLIPRRSSDQIEEIKHEGISPFLTVDTEWRRQDLWVHAAGDDEGGSAEALRAELIDADLYPESLGAAPWGHLAGFRPDPRATTSSRAMLLINRIAEAVDVVVDVSRELLERLRRRTRQPLQQERELPNSKERSDIANERGRPR
jgi:hypothetical protein